MTINLIVQADIVDIRSDVPQSDDVFLVDTNVWLWETYGNATLLARHKPSADRKSREYSAYLGRVIPAGAGLKYSGLILAELAHVIEKIEWEIFKRQNNFPKLTAKEYRHNYPQERSIVAAIVQGAWSQVTMLASSVDLTMDYAVVPGIQVFTSNGLAIQQAAQQGRLISR